MGTTTSYIQVPMGDFVKAKSKPPDDGNIWFYIGKGKHNIFGTENRYSAVWYRPYPEFIEQLITGSDGRISVTFKSAVFNKTIDTSGIYSHDTTPEGLKITFYKFVATPDFNSAKEAYEQYASLGRPIETLTVPEIAGVLAERTAKTGECLPRVRCERKRC